MNNFEKQKEIPEVIIYKLKFWEYKNKFSIMKWPLKKTKSQQYNSFKHMEGVNVFSQ